MARAFLGTNAGNAGRAPGAKRVDKGIPRAIPA